MMKAQFFSFTLLLFFFAQASFSQQPVPTTQACIAIVGSVVSSNCEGSCITITANCPFEKYKIEIFSRWGEVVKAYETKKGGDIAEVNTFVNQLYKETSLTQGTYFCRFSAINKKSKEEKDFNVTVLK